MTTAIFDLDGTIVDPAAGITRSINHALTGLGYQPRPTEELLKYIGPHLKITFTELTGRSDELTLSRGIELYRERYIPIGFKENRLYEGMREVLEELSAAGCTLFVATTKRRDIALKVLDFVGITDFFCEVHGCDLHRSKEDLLRDILSGDARSQCPAVMIGDRDTDFIAASAVGIPSIAVRWGYGPEKELKMASTIVETPQALLAAVQRIAQRAHGVTRDD